MNDLVTCLICSTEMKELHSHLFRKHNMTVTKYKEVYPNASTRCQQLLEAQSKRVSGSGNPAYQHGGKLSPFSTKFIHGDISERTRIKAEQSRKENQSHTTTLAYWMKVTNQDEEQAIRMLTDRQTTFSLKKCLEKYGEANGLLRWQERQQKWSKKFKKQNYSNVSQKLFHSIMEHYASDQVYFATLERSDMLDYQNKEYRLLLDSGKTVLPDFINIATRKIIEFDGTYWHGQHMANPQRELEREQQIIQSGYQLLRVVEERYKKDPQQVLQECLNFLNQ